MLDARFQTKEDGTSSAQLVFGKLSEDSWLLLGSGFVNWDGTVKFSCSVWSSSVGSFLQQVLVNNRMLFGGVADRFSESGLKR